MATGIDSSIIVKAAQSAAKDLGYKYLKEKQLEVLVNFLSGNDVFAVLPTGYGKSLCYTCLPKACDSLFQTEGSIVVVITPLTAIIKDQVLLNYTNNYIIICVYQ